MKKLFAVSALIAASVLLPATSASAYGNLSGPGAAAPGATYTYNVTDLPTVNPVTLTVDGPGDVTVVGLVTSDPKVPTGDSDGPYATSYEVTFPEVGTYTISATQPNNFIDTLTVVVTAAPGDSLSLSATGIQAAPFLWFGGGLLVVGVAFVIVLGVLRRNRVSTHA